MKVLKFGGTSVGSADRIRAVAGLIDNGEPQIVVLSAMSGTSPPHPVSESVFLFSLYYHYRFLTDQFLYDTS